MYLGHFPMPRRAWDAVFICLTLVNPTPALVMRTADRETPGVDFT